MLPNATSKLTLTVDQAANALGISRRLAYQLVRQGRIPSIRLGHRLVVPVAALERMLAGLDSASGAGGHALAPRPRALR